MDNWVEMLADDEDCASDQPCKYGHRVECHSVYCHNDKWKDAPRKCRRTWYWGRKEKGMQDEDCPGFAPNPAYKEPEGEQTMLRRTLQGLAAEKVGQ